MYEFWCDHVKPKYGEKVKLYYIDTDSFNVYIKANDIFNNIAEDVGTRFDTSNYELHNPLTKGENNTVIGLMKGELGGNIMTEFVGLRGKKW